MKNPGFAAALTFLATLSLFVEGPGSSAVVTESLGSDWKVLDEVSGCEFAGPDSVCSDGWRFSVALEVTENAATDTSTHNAVCSLTFTIVEASL